MVQTEIFTPFAQSSIRPLFCNTKDYDQNDEVGRRCSRMWSEVVAVSVIHNSKLVLALH